MRGYIVGLTLLLLASATTAPAQSQSPPISCPLWHGDVAFYRSTGRAAAVGADDLRMASQRP